MKKLILGILDWFHDVLEWVFGDWAEFKALFLLIIIGILFAFYYKGYKDGNKERINKEEVIKIIEYEKVQNC